MDFKQVESPEGNAYDHGRERDREQQHQLAVPRPEDNQVAEAVIGSGLALQAETADREGKIEERQKKRNLRPPRKPLQQPEETEEGNSAERIKLKESLAVARPPPKPGSPPIIPKMSGSEKETEDNADVDSPVFTKQKVGNFEVEQEKREGPGEYGVAVKLSKDDAKRAQRGNREYGFNQVASDLISLDRAIPDTRPTE